MRFYTVTKLRLQSGGVILYPPLCLKMTNRTVRKFVFTLNNYTEEDERRIKANATLFKYIVYGREHAPSTGTKHLQGYGNLKRPTRFSSIKQIIGETAHIETARGTDQHNKEYCEKSGDHWSSGEPTRQGQRSDLEKVVRDIGRPNTIFDDVVRENQSAYIKYHRGMRALFDIIHPTTQRNFKTQVSCNAVGRGLFPLPLRGRYQLTLNMFTMNRSLYLWEKQELEKAEQLKKLRQMALCTTNPEENGGTDMSNKILSSLMTSTGGLNMTKSSRFATDIHTKCLSKEVTENSTQKE